MLLSRALCRGYGMSRARWPVHFGLLRNDCFWVLDETQLMGVGVETAAQLEGLRSKLGTVGRTRTVFMSATLGRSQFAAVNHPEPSGRYDTEELREDDLGKPAVLRRTTAAKPIGREPYALS